MAQDDEGIMQRLSDLQGLETNLRKGNENEVKSISNQPESSEFKAVG